MSINYSLGLYNYEGLAQGNSDLPNSLNGSNIPPSCAILELLTGNINIYNEDNDPLLGQRNNFCLLPYAKNTQSSKDLYENLFDINFENSICTEFDRFFTKDRCNTNTYEGIINELTKCILTLSKSPSESFIHLYRTLEFMSYSFPLIYSSKSKNYRGSFTALKSYFSGSSSEGELKFFSHFLETLFDNEKTTLEFSFDIYIDTTHIEELRKDFSVSINPNLYSFEENTLSIKFKNIQNLIVDIRNKYFHMLAGSGANNFLGTDYDINDLLKSIIPYFINWIAIIYQKIIQYGLESI